jgi:RNA polymerase sigma-70 factor (ECF subfamily)
MWSLNPIGVLDAWPQRAVFLHLTAVNLPSPSSSIVIKETHVDTALTTVLSPAAVQTAQGVSAEQFDALIRQHQRRVYRVIFLLVRDPDAADTLTQECFLRAYRKWNSFRGECRVETWLLRIAVNLARDHAKNRRVSFWRRLTGLEEETDRALTVASQQPSPERVLLAREEASAVWKVTTSLPAQQRAIFLLRFAEEMSLAEIAGVLGLRIGSVKAQLSRATGKVRGKIKEQQWR